MEEEVKELLASEDKRLIDMQLMYKDNDISEFIFGLICVEDIEKKLSEIDNKEKSYIEFLNTPCKECNNGTLVKNCKSLYHKLPKTKFKETAYNTRNK